MPHSASSIPTEQLLKAYAAVARPCIRRRYAADSCIASTRIAMDVLEVFGHEARPLSVKLSLFNPAMHRLLATHGFPDSKATMERWIREHGAWSVGVGKEPEPSAEDRWPGHLVAVVNKSILLDASLDQARRPQRGLHVPDVLQSPTDRAFLKGRNRLVVLDGLDGGLAIYEAVPHDRSYNLTPDWNRPGPRSVVVRDIVDAMLQVLESREG